MRTKRLFCSILALAVSVSAFAGCSKTEQTASNSNVVTLEWWTGNRGSAEFDTARVEEFNETKGKELGVKINYFVKDMSQMDVLWINNEEPDICTYSQIAKGSEQGYLIPYEEINGLSELIGNYDQEILTEGKFRHKGKTFSLPCSKSAQGLVFNKDLFKQAGIVDADGNAKPPETWEELRTAAQKITALGDNTYGIVYPMKWSGWWGYCLGWVCTPEKGYTGWDHINGGWDSTGVIPYMQSVLDTTRDKTAYPGCETLDNDPARARFSEGKIGMIFAVEWDCEVFETQFPAKCEWGVAPLPTTSKEEKYMQVAFPGMSMMVTRKMREKLTDEQITEIIKYFDLSKDAQLDKYENGICFPWDADVIDMTDGANISEHWKQFAEISKISVIRPSIPKTDTTGERTLENLFKEEVLMGKMTPDEAVEMVDKAKEAGRTKYLNAHPEDAEAVYVFPDMDFRRK